MGRYGNLIGAMQGLDHRSWGHEDQACTAATGSIAFFSPHGKGTTRARAFGVLNLDYANDDLKIRKFGERGPQVVSTWRRGIAAFGNANGGASDIDGFVIVGKTASTLQAALCFSSSTRRYSVPVQAAIVR